MNLHSLSLVFPFKHTVRSYPLAYPQYYASLFSSQGETVHLRAKYVPEAISEETIATMACEAL